MATPSFHSLSNGQLKLDEITPERVGSCLSLRLRQIIGSGRAWNYAEVARLTGIDVRTLKAYTQGSACPNLEKYKRLLAVLGPEIGTELNAMKGWEPRDGLVPPEALDLFELKRVLERAKAIVALSLNQQDPEQSAHDCRHKPDNSDRFLTNAPGSQSGAIDSKNQTLPEFRAALHPEKITAAAIAARLGYRLRRMIGPNHEFSLKYVSETTRINRRTLQSYLDGASCPNLARYIRLGYLLGPEVGVELAYMIGWEPRFTSANPLADTEKITLHTAFGNAASEINSVLKGKARGTHIIRLSQTRGKSK